MSQSTQDFTEDSAVTPIKCPLCQSTHIETLNNGRKTRRVIGAASGGAAGDLGRPDDATGESRPGGEAALEQFGLRCARDAMRLGRWQEIALKNHWQILPAE